MILKVTIKLLMWLLVLVSIMSSMLTLFVISDAKEFYDRMQTDKKVFLLNLDGSIRTGFEYYNFDTVPLNIKEADYYFKSGDYDKILSSGFKLFIFGENSFQNVRTIYLESLDKTLTKKDVFEIIRSGNAVLAFAEKLGKPEVVIRSAYTNEQIKMLLFSRVISEEMQNQGGLFLINLHKGKKLVIYPEGLLFKAVKVIPSKYLGNLFVTQKA